MTNDIALGIQDQEDEQEALAAFARLDIQHALAGDPETWVGRYTAWELQQIVLRRDFFDMTDFYLHGRRITKDEAETLGIVRPNSFN
jgi:hypothetical protein